MTLTFDLLTPKSIGVFLSLSSICVWSMKSVGRTLFELSRYNEVWTDGRTDRQTDRRTDRRTDKVITIGLPHLRWRGPDESSLYMVQQPKPTLYISNNFENSKELLIEYVLESHFLMTYSLSTLERYCASVFFATRRFQTWATLYLYALRDKNPMWHFPALQCNLALYLCHKDMHQVSSMKGKHPCCLH